MVEGIKPIEFPLPLHFNFDEPGVYPVTLYLTSIDQSDVRSFQLECTVLPEVDRLESTMKAALGQTITQHVPCISRTSSDTLTITKISGADLSFSDPPSMLVKEDTTGQYSMNSVAGKEQEVLVSSVLACIYGLNVIIREDSNCCCLEYRVNLSSKPSQTNHNDALP